MNLPRKLYKLLWRRARRRKYQAYLRSPYWLGFRRGILKRRNKCKKCGSKKDLRVHHKRYYDDKGLSVLGRERAKDVIVLCKKCHEKEHRG